MFATELLAKVPRKQADKVRRSLRHAALAVLRVARPGSHP